MVNTHFFPEAELSSPGMSDITQYLSDSNNLEEKRSVEAKILLPDYFLHKYIILSSDNEA